MQEAVKEYVAVDFGTTNSVIYLYKNGKPEAVPSGSIGKQGSNLFPSFVEYTKGRVVVGNAARNNFGKNNKFVVAAVKRILGLTYAEYLSLEDKSIFGCEVKEGPDGYPRFVVDDKGKQVTPVEVASEIFKTIKKEADEFCNLTHKFAYVTVPANFKDHQCSAIREAAEKAGLTVEKLIAEPTAAAMSWCLDHMKEITPGEKILVYDFGGGTFDVSLLEFLTGNRFNIINVGGNPKLGGNDVDTALMNAVLDKHHFNTHEDISTYLKSNIRKNKIRQGCEEMKIDITTRCKYKNDEQEFYNTNAKVEGEVQLNSKGDSVAMFAREFTDAIRTKVIETIDITTNTLRNSQPSFTPYNIRHVILVGGSSHLHLIKQLLVTRFVRADFHDVNPDEAVAQGCLRLLIHLKDPKNSNATIRERIVISYGLQSGSSDVALLLKKGDLIPAETRPINFTNSSDYEEEYYSVIYQWVGDLKNATLKNNVYLVPIDQCTEVRKLRFKNPYPQPKETQRLSIQYRLDIGGTLEVICRDVEKDEILSQTSFTNIYSGVLCVCSKCN